MRYAAGGLALLFLLALLCLLLRIYLESRREREKPAEIPGDELPPALREAALQPLRRLAQYYLKRDPEQADACMEETMLPDDMLILGTNPLEIFRGREGARNLLQGDWRSWGLASLDADGTALGRAGDTLHFVMRGQIRLDFFEQLADGRYRRSTEEFSEHIWQPAQIEALLHETGFTLLEVLDGDTYSEPVPETQRLLYIARASGGQQMPE